MVSAVGNDLARIVEVDLLVDSRLVSTDKLGELIEIVEVHSVDSHAGLKTKLQSLAKSADAILLIAPETDACLAEAIGWLGNEHHKLISPSLDFVTATSDKNQLADRLIQNGFNEIPNGVDLKSFLKLSAEQRTAWFPVVVKPADGVGSEGCGNISRIARSSAIGCLRIRPFNRLTFGPSNLPRAFRPALR